MKSIISTIAVTSLVLGTSITLHAKSLSNQLTSASCKSNAAVAQPKYEGFATCKVKNPVSGDVEVIKEFVPITETSQVELTSKSTGENCIANVPYSYSESKLNDSCKVSTQSASDIDYAVYEYGACHYYTRYGFIYWENISGATYQLQEENSGSWYTVYSGSNTGVAYNKSPGPNGKSYSLRIRATVNGQTGSWYNFSAYVPGCWNGDGPEPQ